VISSCGPYAHACRMNAALPVVASKCTRLPSMPSEHNPAIDPTLPERACPECTTTSCVFCATTCLICCPSPLSARAANLACKPYYPLVEKGDRPASFKLRLDLRRDCELEGLYCNAQIKNMAAITKRDACECVRDTAVG
jgi:hypothetical protein